MIFKQYFRLVCQWTLHWIGVVLVLVLALSQSASFNSVNQQQFQWMKVLERNLYDWRLTSTQPRHNDDPIVIVDIDESSLASISRWPWHEGLQAELLNRLFKQYQVKMVGYNIVFAGGEASSFAEMIQEFLIRNRKKLNEQTKSFLEYLSKGFDYESQFEAALKDRPVVLGYYLTADQTGFKTGALPPPAFDESLFRDTHVNESFLTFNGYGANSERFSSKARTAGFINEIPDPDGPVRRIPALAKFINQETNRNEYYMSLATSMWKLSLGQVQTSIVMDEDNRKMTGLEFYRTDNPTTPIAILPLLDDGTVNLTFEMHSPDKTNSFDYISARDVLLGDADISRLKGKYVIIGSTAAGLQDFVATPIRSKLPRVEIQAHFLASLLAQHFLIEAPNAATIELILIFAITLGLTIVILHFGSGWGALLAVLMIIAITSFNAYQFQIGYIHPLTNLLLLVGLIYTLNTGLGYLLEGRKRTQIANLFGAYVPAKLVDQMVQDPKNYSMKAENKELTVLFCDIHDFTGMTEKMTPQEVREMLNQLFSTLSAIISEYQGTLDKYVGDAMMAFWGAPVTLTNHAELAVKASLAMLAAVEKQQAIEAKPNIMLGFGINTGMMFVGDMGSIHRRSYTVLGDAVNTGSRIEALTRIYGVQCLVGEETMQQCKDIAFREIDYVQVKGKLNALKIYEPLKEKSALSLAEKDLLTRWSQALSYYRNKQWEDALRAFNYCLVINPRDSQLYSLYIERVKYLLENPPDSNWTPMINYTNK